jgi:hypothetical protein
VLLETQVAVAVTSCSGPLESVASAVKQVVAVELSGRLTEVGLTVIAVTLPRVTVALAVALAVPDDAVIVALPTVIPFSSPPEVIVAVLGSELDQQTDVPEQVVPPVRVYEFPSLSVPAAFNCSVWPWLTLGADGSIVMEVIVGFWKNPRQLAAKARVARAANAPAMRSLDLRDDIVI